MFFKGPFWVAYFWRGLSTSPGWLSNLITMLRHSMAVISKIGDFRTAFVFFIFYSVLLALCTHKSIGDWREIYVSNRLGQPYSWKEIYRFCFVLLWIWGHFQVQALPPRGGGGGGLYLEGRFNGGLFCVTCLGGLYLKGLIERFQSRGQHLC